MALVLADRVQETTTSTGTASVLLSGAVNGYQTFTAGVGNGNTCYYTIYDSTSFAWEVGIGTYTTSPNTLTRNTILSSSNSGSAINLAGNTAAVWVDYPSGKSVYKDANGNVSANSFTPGWTSNTTASATTTLTVISSYYQRFVGTLTQTVILPDATTVSLGQGFIIDNDSTGNVTLLASGGGALGAVVPGMAAFIFCENNSTAAGSWSGYMFVPGAGPSGAVTWGTSGLNMGGGTLSGATWAGNTISMTYGGTGASLLPTAGASVYSTGTNLALTAAGTSGQVLVSGGSGSPTWNTTLTSISLVTPALGTPSSGVLTNTTGYPASTLSGSTLASNVIASSLTSVGTLSTLAVTAIISGSITGSAASVAGGYVSSNVAGTGVSVSGATGAVTISIGQAVGTSANVQFGSFGVGTAASGTTGEIRATNNVTAYYSSDRNLKENIKPIDAALQKVEYIGGKTFSWTQDYITAHGGEDEYFLQKNDFGVIAQDVQSVFPMAVKTRTDGTLAVDYAKLVALAFQAIAELKAEVDALKGK